MRHEGHEAMSMDFLEELDRHENELIKKFRSRLLSTVMKIPDDGFKQMLVQKRFISLSFTPLYDCAIDSIEDGEGKTLLRHLLREEYPQGQSHREDLVEDLTKIGLTKKEILDAKPTQQTLESLKALFGLLSYQEKFLDIKILVSLRTAEELLVGEEYEIILGELKKRFGFDMKDSVFYAPHAIHDKKQKPFGRAGGSHTDGFNNVLARLIDSREKCEAAKMHMDEACEARLSFFSQFHI